MHEIILTSSGAGECTEMPTQRYLTEMYFKESLKRRKKISQEICWEVLEIQSCWGINWIEMKLSESNKTQLSWSHSSKQNEGYGK